MIWFPSRYERHRFTEKVVMWIAWHLPRKVAMWAFVRVAVDGWDTHPDDRKASDALNHWEGRA